MEKQQESPSSIALQTQDFSFTVSSLHFHTPTADSSSAIDLSPADEIFFHGHLLPLHLLSHFALLPSSSSARSSFSTTTSIDDDDTFTLPIDDKYSPTTDNNSVLVIDDEETRKKRRNAKFEVSTALKRCMRMMMNPSFLFRRRRRRRDTEFGPQNLGRRSFKLSERRERSAYYSAPTSGMTSPTNSGLLGGRPLFPAGDSTGEELQAAVQAAIAYCKRSIEVEAIKNS